MDIDQQTGLRALVRLCADTDLEFLKQKTKQGPLFWFMLNAREEAIQALASLVSIPPTETAKILLLQNEVQRFIDSVAFVQKVFREGYEAAKVLSAEEADELRAIALAEDGQIVSGDEA